MSAVDASWDAAMFRLIEENDDLRHPSWCDLSVCSVGRDLDGSLTSFHESRPVGTVEIDTWQSGQLVVSVAQFATDSAPVVRVAVALDDMFGTVPLALGDVAPLIAAITAAAEVAR